jgi:diguanylate cyclase (GGDEF)-like protein
MSSHNDLIASHRVLSLMERACEYSEQILDDIPGVFVVLNQDNRVIRANKAFCDMAGCTMETALHLPFDTFFTTENRKILQHHIRHVRAETGREANARFKLEIGGNEQLAEGKPFLWRLFRLEQDGGAEGEVVSLIGEDLSSLYKSELKLMNIFASIPLGLMVVDARGNIMEVLSDYCHVMLEERMLAGECLQDLLMRHNPDMQRELIEAFDVLYDCEGKALPDYARREGALHRIGQFRIVGDGPGEKWLKPRFQPIMRNDLIDSYMVILEDVTAATLAQRQIEKADLLGKQAQALYECAIRDPLSGLYTRLFMNDSISRLISSAKRGNLLELSVVMFDIDNFKSVNDTYGHDAGDKVIREFGRIIRSCTRDTDIAVRYGGEEFVVALPCNDTQETGGAVLAERIRAKLANTPINLGSGRMLHVTTSCGVAYCHADDTLDALIQRADKYLYVAKHGGKNQVCVEPFQGE